MIRPHTRHMAIVSVLGLLLLIVAEVAARMP
jgi:hypothetical protein